MISTDKKFLFIHIPKTGGNAIRLALLDYADDELVFNEKQQAYNEAKQEPQRFGIRNPHIDLDKHGTLAKAHSRWDEKKLGQWDSYYKFACVRNPWDRLVSLYFSPHLGRGSFDEAEFIHMINDTKKGNQSAYVIEDGEVATDFLIRFERLKQDFERLSRELGIIPNLSCVNQGKHRPYREYYNNKTKDLVYRLYQRDIDLFGYEFDD